MKVGAISRIIYWIKVMLVISGDESPLPCGDRMRLGFCGGKNQIEMSLCGLINLKK